MSLGPWAVVARREYVCRVRSGSFRLGTIVGPIVVGAAVGLPLGSPGPYKPPALGILDRAGLWQEDLLSAHDGGSGPVAWPAPPTMDERAAREMVAEGVVDAMLVVSEDAGEARLLVRSSLASAELAQLRAGIELALCRAASRKGAGASQLSHDAWAGSWSLRTVPVAAPDPSRAAALATVVAMLLYATLLAYGLATMRAVIEEKATRVVELLLTSARPVELLLGKIIGIAAVGLTQYAVWVGASVALFAIRGPSLGVVWPGAAQLPSPGLVVAAVAFFALGYAFFAALYTIVGGMVSLPADAQHAHLPVTALLVVPIVLVWPVVASPDSPTSRILSMVPPFAPVLMVARMARGGVPTGEWASAMGALAVAGAASLWCAGRVYAAGLLRRGGLATFSEVIRWIRKS